MALTDLRTEFWGAPRHWMGFWVKKKRKEKKREKTTNDIVEHINRVSPASSKTSPDIARNASHFTAKHASSAFVTIERLSTKTRWPRADRPLRWSAPTGSESNSKISEVESLLIDFFPYFCWLLHRADVLHLPITSRLTGTFLFVALCVCEWQGCLRTFAIFLSYYY